MQNLLQSSRNLLQTYPPFPEALCCEMLVITLWSSSLKMTSFLCGRYLRHLRVEWVANIEEDSLS